MIDDDEKPFFSRAVDLEQASKTALSRRELAWNALRQTRNPEYVALRYNYPVETMRRALLELERRNVQQQSGKEPQCAGD